MAKAIACAVLLSISHMIGKVLTSRDAETGRMLSWRNTTSSTWHCVEASECVTINSSMISAKCHEDLLYMMDINGHNRSSYSRTPNWQKHMVDAYGKLAAGLLEGNRLWFGEFKQCTDVQVWKNSKSEQRRPPDFKGKYCLHTPTPASVMSFRYGVCMPSTCTNVDVETLINEYLHPKRTKVSQSMCSTNDWSQPDGITYLAIAPFALLTVIVGIASICDGLLALRKVLERRRKHTRILHEKQGTAWKILLCFSLVRNTKSLLDTSHRNEALSCINGMRAVAMTVVIVCHGILYGFITAVGVHNPITSLRLMKKFFVQPVISAPYALDTFLCMTAFLVTHTLLQHSMKMKRFNIFVFYLHRYWRLTPALLLMNISAMGPYQLLGDGPLWPEPSYFPPDVCRNLFWKAFLYINIYSDAGQFPQCLNHTWYLEVDMFLYLMSPILLYPMLKKHWSTPVLGTIAYISIVTAIAVIAYIHKLDSMISIYMKLMHFSDNFKYIFSKPWARGHSYLIGMLFGYLYYYKGKSLKLSKKQVSIAWIFIALTMFTCIFINYPYSAGITESGPTRLYSSLYTPIGQSAFTFSTGLTILLCASGYGGVINKILSWNLLVPIGRLSFCAYLVHAQVGYYFVATKKHSIYTDAPLMYSASVTIFAMALFFGYVLCMMVERPSICLEGILVTKVLKNLDKKSNTQLCDIRTNPSL